MLRLAVKRGLFGRAPPPGLLAPYATEVGKTSLVRDPVSLNTCQTLSGSDVTTEHPASDSRAWSHATASSLYTVRWP